MSQENVELVLGLTAGPDVDLARMLRDEEGRVAMAKAIGPFLRSDFECIIPRFDMQQSYAGIAGLTTAWLEWTAPWATYRTEIEEAVDLGDRVLVLVRDFGRREGTTQEVELTAAAVWTVRDGRIARAEFYASRDDALKAVGLRE